MPDTFTAGIDCRTALYDLTVVVLNDFCYVQGGASKVAIDDAVSLAEAGIKVIFVGAVGPVCAELKRSPMEIICLNQPELLNFSKRPSVVVQGLWNMDAGRKVEKVLSTLQPDRTIVHLHGYTKALTVNPVRIARDLGFDIVCTLHDFFPACPNGAFFDYRRGQPCERRALSPACMIASCDKRHYAHKMFRVARALVQRNFGQFPRLVEHYIYLSSRSRDILAPYLPTHARLYGLENAIDWARPQKVESSKNRTILYVGRLDQEKGVLLLARAAMELGLDVMFVGDGPLRSEVESITKVPITGWLTREEVRQHLTRARCLVFPSMWYETYGLVVAEASAYGIPVIVSDVTAAAERVRNDVTGWTFRSGDLTDLVRCLKLIESDEQVRKVGDMAYQTFWANATTASAHADSLIGIYRAILEE